MLAGIGRQAIQGHVSRRGLLIKAAAKSGNPPCTDPYQGRRPVPVPVPVPGIRQFGDGYELTRAGRRCDFAAALGS